MPAQPPDADTLLVALRDALSTQGSPWADASMARLKDKGLAHDHVRLAGTGVLARIPKQSQMRLRAHDNLAYQAACFERAADSGHVPRLLGVLPPSAPLPRGALMVEDIDGGNAALPDDLRAIIGALASIHALPLPEPEQRRPLMDVEDPLQALQEEIMGQAAHLSAAAVDPAVLLYIEAELARLRRACSASARPQRHLIAFDGHPGNFLVRADGSAVLVDLEKCRYSYPGLDLAHATLYTSTTWDLDSHAVLQLPEVMQACVTWADAVGPQAARAAQPWLVPLRRAMWLWSITWCAKWRAVSGAASPDTADGEDWSTSRSDAALVTHVRGRVDHYLSPAVVAQARDEFESLDKALGS